MAVKLIEPFGVPDIFVKGIGEVEDLGGGNRRVTFYTRQKFGGECSNVVVVHLVVHENDIAQCMSMMAGEGRVTCAEQPSCPVLKLN